MIDFALLAQVLFWLTLVGIFLASGQASLFHPLTVYLAFHGLVFVLRPILVNGFGFDTNWNYMVFKPTAGHFVETLAVSSVALLSFFVACLAAGWTRVSFAGPAPRLTALEQRALIATILLLLPVAAYSIYSTRNGIAGERVNGIYIMTGSTGYLNEAQHFVMPLLCAMLVLTRFHWANLFPVLLYISYRVWFGWSRWTILLFLLMVVLTYCWYSRKKWLPWWSVAIAVPALILFNVLGHNRDFLKQILVGQQVQVVQEDPGMTPEEKIKAQIDTQDYANFDYLSYIVSIVPDRTGRYTYGLQYLQLFTEPIPRLLWKGKPIGAPVRTIDINAYGNFTGLTVSLCGDAWMSGGWAGLVIMLSLVGIVLGRLHRWFWRHADRNLGALGYIITLAMVPQWYRDGGISIAKFLLFTLLPILVWKGMKWILDQRLVPAYSVWLPPNTRVRFVPAAPAKPDGQAASDSTGWRPA